MHFLTLIDPVDTGQLSGRALAEQRRVLWQQFESRLRQSRLRYYRPGMPFDRLGNRLLLGLAPNASMIELRLADLLNEQVISGQARCQIDLFNLEDLTHYPHPAEYFTQSINIVTTPVAAYWQSGRLVDLLQGSKAIIMAMQHAGFKGSFESMRGRLCPPEPL